MTKTTQFELEAQMQDRGYARFLKQIEAAKNNEGQSNTAYGREVIKANMDTVLENLEGFIQSQETVRRKAPAAKLLKGLNLEAVVYLALKTIVNSLGHDEAKTTATAINIGLAVSNAVTLAALGKDKETKGLVKHIEASSKRAVGNDNAKSKSVAETLTYFNMQSAWSTEDQLKVGVTLIELAAQAGLIENVTVGGSKTKFNKLVPTDKTMEMIEVMNLCPEFAPIYLPMVVEPKDWDQEGNGGYLTLRQPLVKTRFEGHTEALQEADLTSVRGSINIIQQTAWKVHTGLLSIAQRAMEGGLDLDCLPFNYKDDRAKRTSIRVGATTVLGLAEEFKDRDAIWFPHNMDWRGRVYPMVDGLSPQGNKLAKALLSFAEGKRITDGAESFLAIHIANEFGKDKLSLADRVSWVFENEDMLIEVANNPFGEHKAFWMTADSPWGFLRGCIEWAGYCEAPEDFMSTLPVAFDGSCSGLQHFSAMFKDEVGGREVNLLPNLDRQDIYSAVQKAVEGTLSASSDPLASQWLKSGLMGRSLFKTPTMTYGYSSEVPGMTDQIKEYVITTDRDAFAKDDLFLACNYLAKTTFAEIENIVVKAAEAKTWLQSCVKGKNEATQWTTPDGLVVVQKYKVKKSNRLNILVGGERVQSRYDVNTDKVDTRKMASSISPNVIHSLDAAHIRMVAVAASQEQVHSLALIHDSFGCHAADAGRFFNIIREEFVKLYTQDVAEMLNAELSGGMVELPLMGNLDLEGIIDTDYSFA
jgi:DNA-directed RNA polymerase